MICVSRRKFTTVYSLHSPKFMPQVLVGFFLTFVAVLVSAEQRRRAVAGLFQLGHSTEFQCVMALYMVANACSACLGSFVGKKINATGRSILECCRTITTWLIELFLIAGMSGWSVASAEKLDVRRVDFWTEKVGFIIVVLGTFLYFRIITCERRGKTNGSKE